MVCPAVLVCRRIDADREGDDISEQYRRERDDESHQQPVADHLVYRQVVCKRIAHITVQQTARPEDVLLPKREIKAVLCLQKVDLRKVCGFARALQFCDVR